MEVEGYCCCVLGQVTIPSWINNSLMARLQYTLYIYRERGGRREEEEEGIIIMTSL